MNGTAKAEWGPMQDDPSQPRGAEPFPEALSTTFPVRTRAELVEVVEELIRRHESGSPDFSNRTLERYLEAIAAWIADARPDMLLDEGAVEEGLQWQLVANCLRAGRGY